MSESDWTLTVDGKTYTVERVGVVTVDAHDVVASLEPNTGPDCQIEGRMVAVLIPAFKDQRE